MKGVIRIISFNRDWYALGAAGVTAGVLVGARIPLPYSALVWAGTAIAFFWLAASIAASYYIYDRSRFYEFQWLADCLPNPPRCWVNVHAGLNDLHLSGGEGCTLDIFDPEEMTEPSIRRARRLPRELCERADWRALPIDDECCDAVFLIFTVHELRRHEVRVQLLWEAERILRPGGRIVLTEHLRDGWNFLAFGPGFLHFYSERTWLRAAEEAGLKVQKRLTITPFVHTFVLGRAYDPDASADCGVAVVGVGRGA